MIVHDLTTLSTTLIGRAVLTVSAYSGLTALLLVLAIYLITAAVTGNVPAIGRRARKPAAKYDEAA
ncbi:hypothetical protein [Streptomyces sp. BH105]|uniref:hypothetical protein n=1 Tax=Streptomyces sp. BH105 TaxID=3410408 RepID=UPI003CF48270